MASRYVVVRLSMKSVVSCSPQVNTAGVKGGSDIPGGGPPTVNEESGVLPRGSTSSVTSSRVVGGFEWESETCGDGAFAWVWDLVGLVVLVLLVVLVVGEQLVEGGESSELAVEMLAQLPSFFGRQVVQDFPDLTQAHPLQEPVLLHLQQTIFSLLLRLVSLVQTGHKQITLTKGVTTDTPLRYTTTLYPSLQNHINQGSDHRWTLHTTLKTLH